MKLRTLALLPILCLWATPAHGQSARDALLSMIQQPPPESASICLEMVRGQQKSYEALSSSVAPKSEQQLNEGWRAFQQSCQILQQGGAGDFRSVALERWRFGSKRIREALNVEGATEARQEPSTSMHVQKKILERSKGRAVFAYPKDAVWVALMEALTDANFSPQSLDKESGTIFFQSDQAWGRAWGDANGAVSLLTTKKVGRASTCLAIAAKANIFCKATDEATTEVKVNVVFSGCNGWQSLGTNYSCIWETLATNGHAENLIFDGIERRLAERPAGASLLPASQPDTVAVAAAEQALLAVQRLASAEELGLGKDDLTRYLVDARTAVEIFHAAPSAGILPLFDAALQEAVEGFRAAAVDAAEGKAAAIARARRRLDDAKKYLSNYRVYVQEPTPEK